MLLAGKSVTVLTGLGKSTTSTFFLGKKTYAWSPHDTARLVNNTHAVEATKKH